MDPTEKTNVDTEGGASPSEGGCFCFLLRNLGHCMRGAVAGKEFPDPRKQPCMSSLFQDLGCCLGPWSGSR